MTGLLHLQRNSISLAAPRGRGKSARLRLTTERTETDLPNSYWLGWDIAYRDDAFPLAIFSGSPSSDLSLSNARPQPTSEMLEDWLNKAFACAEQQLRLVYSPSSLLTTGWTPTAAARGLTSSLITRSFLFRDVSELRGVSRDS
jgi:hypothetical protein